MPRKTPVKKSPLAPAEPAGEMKKPVVRKRAVRAAPAKPIDQDVQLPAAQTRLVLDYPQAAETVLSRQYTLRLSAPEGAPSVEVSIDGGEWRPCRFAVGHWWYDWENYTEGSHQLRARAKRDGDELTLERSVSVLFGQ